MRTSNLANEALRHAEVGQVWEEVLTNGTGTLKLKPYQTFRVRSTGAATVTIDGVLAMTMTSGEIIVFNTGSGVPSAVFNKQAIETIVIIAGAGVFVQVARENIRKP